MVQTETKYATLRQLKKLPPAPMVASYFEKKQAVIRRCADRATIEARVRYLEGQFRATNPFLEKFRRATLETQLGEAYATLMKLRRVKVEK